MAGGEALEEEDGEGNLEGQGAAVRTVARKPGRALCPVDRKGNRGTGR